MDFDFIVLISILSSISGCGSYLHSVRHGNFSWLGLLTELTLSISVGLCVAYFCLHQEWSKELAYCLAIVASNNGGDCLNNIKKILSQVIEKKFGIKLDDEKK